MINILHHFVPNPIIFSLGAIQVRWYGLCLMLGIAASLWLGRTLARLCKISDEDYFDLAFWVILNGLIGARVYEIFLELPYYLANPLEIPAVWHGGLAIHGAIIGGAITVWYWAKKHSIRFWQLAAIVTTTLPLGQAIGRWGNYFNQELFGRPTDLPWGIPIEYRHRPVNFSTDAYFQPTFLYESIGSLIILGILIVFWKKCFKNPNIPWPKIITLTYIGLYSLLRFVTELIRIDATPTLFSLRWPAILSLILAISSLIWLIIVVQRSKTPPLEKK
ncbi:MAG: prolipoprotein diacylglyceryl transferase [Candidatus Falkowbacteria bacterium]